MGELLILSETMAHACARIQRGVCERFLYLPGSLLTAQESNPPSSATFLLRNERFLFARYQKNSTTFQLKKPTCYLPILVMISFDEITGIN